MFSETLPTHLCMPLHVCSLRPYDILHRTSVCVAVRCNTLQCTVYVVSSTCIPASRPALLFALKRAATYYRTSAATRCNTLQCTVYVVFSTYIPASQPALLFTLHGAAICCSTSAARAATHLVGHLHNNVIACIIVCVAVSCNTLQAYRYRSPWASQGRMRLTKIEG